MNRIRASMVAALLTAGLASMALAVPPVEANDPLIPDWMQSGDIHDAFSGRTIDGYYADKRRFTERYDADGRLVYVEPYVRNAGRWSVRANAFCTIYDRDPTGGCYRVEKLSANCFAFYFISRSERQAEDDPLKRPKWTARGWRQDEPSTCEEAGVA